MAVLIYTENWDGKFKKLSFELVSYGHELAKQMETTLVILSIGNVEDSEYQKLGTYGAEKIVCVNDGRITHLNNSIYGSVISQVATKENASVVLFGNTNSGKAIAPFVSVRILAGMVAGVMALPSNLQPFTVRKKVFTGKALADMIVRTPIRVLTLAQNSFGLVENPARITLENFTPELEEKCFFTEVKAVNKLAGKILLTDAEIVVSGGRGMKGPEYWGPVEELAVLLGGATACSRPVSDEGWRPHEEHTGQTGKIIAPNLYIACGISGAIQHLAGVSSSKVMVAINKDKEAPVFESATYGVIGDVHKVLPDFVAAVKEFKAEN